MSHFTAQTVLLVGNLRAMVEAAGIEFQSEKRSKRKRLAPIVAPKMLG